MDPIRSLQNQLQQLQYRRRTLRDPLPPPVVPEWVWLRARPYRPLWRLRLAYLIPEIGFLNPRRYPETLDDTIRAWNVWLLNETAGDSSALWLAVATALGILLLSMASLPVIGVGLKSASALCLILAARYGVIAARYQKVKAAWIAADSHRDGTAV